MRADDPLTRLGKSIGHEPEDEQCGPLAPLQADVTVYEDASWRASLVKCRSAVSSSRNASQVSTRVACSAASSSSRRTLSRAPAAVSSRRKWLSAEPKPAISRSA